MMMNSIWKERSILNASASAAPNHRKNHHSAGDADFGRPLHDKACALKVAHNAFDSDCRHVLVSLMNALATFEPQGADEA
jgi:hypothetical protein